jgi:hypothetical protein
MSTPPPVANGETEPHPFFLSCSQSTVRPLQPYKTQPPSPLPRSFAQTAPHHPTRPPSSPRANQLLSRAERELGTSAAPEEKGGNDGRF